METFPAPIVWRSSLSDAKSFDSDSIADEDEESYPVTRHYVRLQPPDTASTQLQLQLQVEYYNTFRATDSLLARPLTKRNSSSALVS